MNQLPDFTLIRSHRHSISIHVTPDNGVVVRAPHHSSQKFIEKFIIEKNDWITKALSKTQKHKAKQYINGEEFLYLGNVYKLSLGDHKQISAESGILNFPQCLLFRAKKELHTWYIKQAEEVITKRVQHFSKVMNTNYKSISFSDTKSKWGTCGPDNSLQFNWRLVMSPLLVIDYVVVHELAHTFEKNHSREFWIKVAIYKPAYKQHRKWLESNSHRLVI